MISQLLARLVHAPTGGNTEVAFSHEGLSWGWASLLFIVLTLLSWGLYRWAAPQLTFWRRTLLIVIRSVALGLIILLLVKPVVLLTLNEPVRERLIVALDSSLSMQIKDHRTSNEDRNRAAIAAGVIPAKSDLKGAPASGSDKWQEASRIELRQALAAVSDANKPALL